MTTSKAMAAGVRRSIDAVVGERPTTLEALLAAVRAQPVPNDQQGAVLLGAYLRLRRRGFETAIGEITAAAFSFVPVEVRPTPS